MLRIGLAILVSMLWACSSSGSSGGGSGGSATGGTSTGGTSVGGTSAGGSGGTSLGGSAGSASGGAPNDSGSDGAGTNPVVELDTTMGKMTLELDATRMPITTANFMSYVDSGFYSGTLFHRVIPNFVIQGGGFTTGMVQKTTEPPIQLEISPEILHDYGVISMARTTDPNSATSQFFIVNAAAGAHNLDGQYAAFGHLLSGQSVLDAISQVPTQSVGSFDDVPITDVVINSAKRL